MKQNASPWIIELEAVEKLYQIESHSVQALQKVDLKVKKGQVVAVTGRSGSGKSTLLHIIGTLDKPTAGTVKLLGFEVSGVSDYQASRFRNCSVGFVFQMNNLLPEFSALENAMMPGLIAGADKQQVADRARKLLQAVGLEHRLSHRPSELSGGEQQRVAIARALIMNPPLLLADEPTGNLDKKSSETVEGILVELCKKNGVTMLLVTHDVELAQRLPDQVVMEDGTIVSQSGGSW